MDAVILAVAHDQFRKMSMNEIRNLMKEKPVLIDVRGMVDKEKAKKAGIYYQRL
jgi:UDP-N-acetyl-D-galactosamine dehydrogenase